jgi:asparagine synthase (glutamine-hydrolysing)
MCGFYCSNIPYSKEDFKSQLSKIDFRGPDSWAACQIDGIWFGHNRLAIIDLHERSNQPMFDDEVVIVFNGEIYNFIELRDDLISYGYKFKTEGDTEVILNLYKLHGIDFLQLINGMFSIIIYDRKSKDLYCVRDRLGVKPLYHLFNKNGEFEISSQLFSIKNKNKIDLDSLNLFFDFGYIPSPYSIYKNIFKINPGEFLKYNLKSKSSTSKYYWSYPIRKTFFGFKKGINNIKKIITNSINLRLYSDAKKGIFLSSGTDSSILASVCSQDSKEKILSFTVAFKGYSSDESQDVLKNANYLNLDSHIIKFEPKEVLSFIDKMFDFFDEPFSDTASLPLLAMSKEYKKLATVTITGDGGDELFLGYKQYRYLLLLDIIYFIPYSVRKILSKIFNFFSLNKSIKTKRICSIIEQKNRTDCSLIFFTDFNCINNNIYDFLIKRNIYDKLKSIPSIVNKFSFLHSTVWLSENNNVKLDRSSMAFGLELRSPFLDYRLHEYFSILPLINFFPLGSKKLLKKLFKHELNQLNIPKDKKGFSPPIFEYAINGNKNNFINNLIEIDYKNIPGVNIKKLEQELDMFNNKLFDNVDFDFIWRNYCYFNWYLKNFNK